MTDTPGLIIAAPSSGSGKTLITLGLIAALTRRGLRLGAAKVGPDYIDPAFHAAAGGRACRTLDSWAMRPATLAAGIAAAAEGADAVLCEGVMGLFDGADVPHGQPCGSTAEIAAVTGWPVVLVVDARGMAGSAAVVVSGFAHAWPAIRIAGVIFNRVGGERHRRMIRQTLDELCPTVALLGFLPRLDAIALPSRHLGLVQACEHPDLAAFVAAAADLVAQHVDLDALLSLMRPSRMSPEPDAAPPLPPLGHRIALARDEAFAFAYPGILAGWRQAGAEIVPFSPLADQGPAPDCDAVYLPGGYPELHAGRLAGNGGFLGGLRAAAARGAGVWGECGGYMVLGRGLVDGDGHRHAMAGLLPVETSFAIRTLCLGYRRATLREAGSLGAAGTGFRGHEFHFATLIGGEGEPLFDCADAGDTPLPPAGSRVGRVAGSFVHVIDRV
jgi:cobyrinic acid a,c-diamide synthase